MKLRKGSYIKIKALKRFPDCVRVAFTQIESVKNNGKHIWGHYCTKYYGDKGEWRIKKGYVDLMENNGEGFEVSKISKEEFERIWKEAVILNGLSKMKV